MSAYSSTRSNQNKVTATDDPECIIRWAETTRESSFQTAREGIREATTEEVRAKQAWTAALIDKTDNKDESEELEDDVEQSDEMEAPMEAFVTGRDVLAMIADETKKATATMVTESITNTVEEFVSDMIQVGYNLAREGIKAPIFHLVDEDLIYFVQQGSLDTLWYVTWIN